MSRLLRNTDYSRLKDLASWSKLHLKRAAWKLQKSKCTFKFLNLAAELRIEVYKFAVLDAPWVQIAQAQLLYYGENALMSRSFKSLSEKRLAWHTANIEAAMKKRVVQPTTVKALSCVCKQVKAEVLDIDWVREVDTASASAVSAQG